jgi:hypothetical protein
MKGFVIAEQAHVAMGLYPISANGLTTLDAVNMENYGHLTAIVATGALNGADLVVTASASTNNAAGGAEVIPFHYYQETTASTDVLGARVLNSTTALTFGNSAVNNQFAVVELDAAELPEGKPWVNLNLNGAATTTPTAVTYILSGSRYAGAQSPTVLS